MVFLTAPGLVSGTEGDEVSLSVARSFTIDSKILGPGAHVRPHRQLRKVTVSEAVGCATPVINLSCWKVLNRTIAFVAGKT